MKPSVLVYYGCGALVSLSAFAQDMFRKPTENHPDQRVDQIGEFLWARAADQQEEVKLVTPPTAAQPWGKETRDPTRFFRFDFDDSRALKRSNLTVVNPEIAHRVQIKRLLLETTGAHNSKTMLGYMPSSWLFTHGDNGDLVHWALAPRVVLFIPIRHAKGANPENPASYHISPYGGQTLSVVEFQPGELIHYEWYYGAPKKLHERILFDLYPHAGGKQDLKPGLNQPIFQFDVLPNGGWKVQIERDGRDGLKGGEVEDGFDMVFTHESKGAKPYSVDLGKDPHFAISVYCPSGSPNLGAKMLYQLDPYHRKTGKVYTTPPARSRVKDRTVGDLRANWPRVELVPSATGE